MSGFCFPDKSINDLVLIIMSTVLLERIRKVAKYIDYSMLEAREMKEGNGSIYLKVLQL